MRGEHNCTAATSLPHSLSLPLALHTTALRLRGGGTDKEREPNKQTKKMAHAQGETKKNKHEEGRRPLDLLAWPLHTHARTVSGHSNVHLAGVRVMVWGEDSGFFVFVFFCCFFFFGSTAADLPHATGPAQFTVVVGSQWSPSAEQKQQAQDQHHSTASHQTQSSYSPERDSSRWSEARSAATAPALL